MELSEKDACYRFNLLRNKQGTRLDRTVSKRTQELSVYKGSELLASKLLIYTRNKLSDTKYYVTQAGLIESNP